MTREPGRRGRPRDPAVDEAILRAGLELFTERGLEGASIERIAQRAGVARLSVYRRWSSKEALITQALESARDTLPDAAIWPAAQDLPLPELLDRFLDAWAQPLADPAVRTLFTRLIGAGASHPALLAGYWQHYVLPRRSLAATVLERARRAGALAPEADIDAVMDMVVGAVLMRVLTDPAEHDADRTREYLRALLRQAGLTI